MRDSYCVGMVRFPQGSVDWNAVVLACDLVISLGAQIVFGRAKSVDSTTALPFAAKTSAETLLREMFEGCQVICEPLKINFADNKALKIASQVNAINPKKNKVSLASIKPHASKSLLERGIIGRDAQVKMVHSIADVVGAYGRSAIDSLHMMFAGPPGVGKTMLAQALLELYDRKNVTSGKGVFVEASASDLVSQYVGETSHFVQRIFDRADGGILFIDEAYRLSRQSAAVDGTSHGQEAIDAINQLMEERRNDVIVVLAGYPSEMQDFPNQNPGLRGRIGFEVEFEGYSYTDLLNIFGSMAKDRGFEVDISAMHVLEERIPELSRQPGFANARTMRKLLDHAITNKVEGNLDWQLSEVDIQRSLNDKEFHTTEKMSVGFTAR